MTNNIINDSIQRSFGQNLRNLYNSRELLFRLTTREIKIRYRQSVLGFGWALIQPVFQMIVISVIFGNFLRVPSNNFPYPIFAYTAILPWSLFSGSISSAATSVLSNLSLVTKIYFPREILPMSVILSRLVDFFIASIVFIGLIVYYGIPIKSTWLFIPLLLLIQITLALGLGLLASAVSVFVRDISFAMPLVMQIWMYLSPVIYPLEMVPPKWQTIYMLNPMAGLIDSYRRVLLSGEVPNMTYLGLSALGSIVICLLAYLYFKYLELIMADII